MKTVPLQSLCENFKQDVVDGPFGSEMKRSDYVCSGFPVLKIQDVKPMEIRQKSLDFVSPAKFHYLRRHSFRRGDIVITKLGDPLGVAAIVQSLEEGIIVADLVRIRANKIDTKYLCYHLNSPRTGEYINSLQKGTTRPRVTLAAIRHLPIYAPPLPEQRWIVAILDEAFAAIATAKANTEQNLANARAVLESHRQAALTTPGDGWLEKPLADLCDIKHGFAFKSEFFTEEGEYVLLTPGNFFESGGYRDRGDKQKYYKGEIPKGFILTKGDLLVAMTEQAAGLLGSPILVPESNRFLHNQRLGLVQKKSGAAWVNEYFFHVFNLRHVRDAIHESGTGVKVRHTSPTKISEVVVAFPSSEVEQQMIVQRLATLTAETQRLESLAQQKLAVLDALKASLLHHAFTGQLTGRAAWEHAQARA